MTKTKRSKLSLFLFEKNDSQYFKPWVAIVLYSVTITGIIAGFAYMEQGQSGGYSGGFDPISVVPFLF